RPCRRRGGPWGADSRSRSPFPRRVHSPCDPCTRACGLHIQPSRWSYCGFPDPAKERERLSFFDEADEPRTTPRTAPRRRRASGSGRRPPTDQQAIQIRRAVAAVVLLVILILIVLGVHSCQISQRNSSLKDYNNHVAALIQQSDQTGKGLFTLLSSGA